MPRFKRVGSLLSLDLPKTRAGHGGPAIERWWSRRDSNPRQPACKAGALPTELRPRLRRDFYCADLDTLQNPLFLSILKINPLRALPRQRNSATRRAWTGTAFRRACSW